MDGQRHVHHDLQIANGQSGLCSALEAVAKVGDATGYDRINYVLRGGDVALVVSEAMFGRAAAHSAPVRRRSGIALGASRRGFRRALLARSRV